MPKKERVLKKIIKVFEKNIFWLPAYNLGHFFTRVYKISGNKKYENILALYLLATKIQHLKTALATLKSNDFAYTAPERNKKSWSIRKKNRIALYKRNPKIAFYNELLNDLFFLEKFNLLKTFFKKDFLKIISFLKKEDFKKIYLNEDVIKTDSSFAFNSVFYLDYFGISSIKKAAINKLRILYFTQDMHLKQPLKKHDLCSLIYSLTHIIISESHYYEKYVDKYAWIIEYFKNNLDFIIKNTTQDILTEVGLCFKLCKKDSLYRKECNKITSYLIKSLNIQKIEGDIDYLIKKEHTCSLIVLLFSKSKKFFNGPDLSKNNLFN